MASSVSVASSESSSPMHSWRLSFDRSFCACCFTFSSVARRCSRRFMSSSFICAVPSLTYNELSTSSARPISASSSRSVVCSSSSGVGPPMFLRAASRSSSSYLQQPTKKRFILSLTVCTCLWQYTCLWLTVFLQHGLYFAGQLGAVSRGDRCLNRRQIVLLWHTVE